MLKLFQNPSPQDQFQKIPFSYILQNPPISSRQFNKSRTTKCSMDTSQFQNYISQITGIIIKYNQSFWNFGNIVNNNNVVAIHPLMTNISYNEFLDKIGSFSGSGEFTPSEFNPESGYYHPLPPQYTGIYNQYSTDTMKRYNPMSPDYYSGYPQINPNSTYDFNNSFLFNSKLHVIYSINQLLAPLDSNTTGCLLDTFFPLDLQYLFPKVVEIQGSIQINLMGLACLIGAEHLIIYFLKMGGNPIQKNSNNKDALFNLLQTQMGLHQLIRQQSTSYRPVEYGVQGTFMNKPGEYPMGPTIQGQLPYNYDAIPLFYFVADQRIEYILTLLGTIGGTDLSALVKTDIPVNTNILTVGNNPSEFQYLQTNILCNLTKEDSLFTTNMIYGPSSPPLPNSAYNILFFIMSYNNLRVGEVNLLFFNNINNQNVPQGYTPLFYLLGNRIMDNISQKMQLIQLFINQGADPTIMPDIPVFQVNICKVLQLYYQPPYYQQLVSILSRNEKFKNICENISYSPGTLKQIFADLQQRLQYQAEFIAYQANIIRSLESGMEGPYQSPPTMSNLPQAIPPTPVQPFLFDFPPSTKNIREVLSLNKQLEETIAQFQPYSLTPPQAGGKGLRTYYFPLQEGYKEKKFKTIKPKMAAEMAYQYLKIKYGVGNVKFVIEDRIKNQKYRYSGKTRKNGELIVKSI